MAELQKNGVTVLQDQSVLIDHRFYLVGRQDASEEKDFGGSRASISDLTKNLDKDKYTIVLDHQPVITMPRLQPAWTWSCPAIPTEDR